MVDESAALDQGVTIVRSVCQFAGWPSLVTDLRASAKSAGLLAAIVDHNTPGLFDWLGRAASFQGIADRVAEGFLEEHGSVSWADIEASLAQSPACPKLSGYWRFAGCQY